MPYPLDKKLVPPVWVESGGKYKKMYEDAEVQISLLQGQLAQTQSALATAQADLATAQAQIVQDAATIAALQGQVSQLQSQVTALQNQLAAYLIYGTYYWGAVSLHTTGGIYVPPSFNDVTINVSTINSPLIWGPVTRTGGGYP